MKKREGIKYNNLTNNHVDEEFIVIDLFLETDNCWSDFTTKIDKDFLKDVLSITLLQKNFFANGNDLMFIQRKSEDENTLLSGKWNNGRFEEDKDWLNY